MSRIKEFSPFKRTGTVISPKVAGDSLDGVIFAGIKHGTATITAENTYVDVTHTLASTPNWVTVEPTNEYAIDWYKSNIGATTFRINLQVAQASDATYTWSAGI